MKLVLYSIPFQAKKLDRKLHRVALTISLGGIKMVDCVTNEYHLDFSIYRISYCSADATYDHVFTFIATNRNNTMECHAYLCPKRKMAQSATLTIAQAFNLAFECWQSSKERKRRRERKLERKRDDECSCEIGLGRENKVTNTKDTDCQKVKGKDLASCLDTKIDISPSSRYNSSLTDSQDAEGDGKKGNMEDKLLIDLSSPGEESKTITDTWNGVSIVDIDKDNQKWEHFEEDQDENMDLSFTQIAQRNSPLPILRRLPLNAASLQFGSFICSDSLSSSPTSSPLHGSCLTTSQLCTPIGSPASRESLTPRQGRRQWNKEPSPLVISSHQERLDMQEKKGTDNNFHH